MSNTSALRGCSTSQLGTGTRTCCGVVTAETLGLKVEDIDVNIGVSTYPFSGASGGSTTIGAISESHRRAATAALNQLFEKVAPKLEAKAEQLVARNGRIQVNGDSSKSISWREACTLLGMRPLEATGDYKRGDPSPLSNSQVGGVQMAHVAVDKETGVVKMKKFVLVQDMGLIINRLTAESQCYGAAIMGIAGAGTIEAGGSADFVVFRGRSWTELMSRPESDRILVRNGREVRRDIPDYAELDDLMTE